MFSNPSKYYTKYNKNIKSIKGSGVVTSRPPKDSDQTTGTIKQTLHDDIAYMPPFYLRTWDNDKQNTNGYLNEKDYVDYVPDIDRYYYTTQQMDKATIREKGSNKPYEKSSIKLPPPLVTSKPTNSNKQPKVIVNNYISKNKSDKTDKPDKIKYSDDNIDSSTSQYGIGESDINRTWYDGRYLYTFSPSSLETIYPWVNYNLLYPFNQNKDTLQFYQNANIDKITGDPLLRDNSPNSMEYFDNLDNKKKTTLENIYCMQNYNILYLTILCILIVIYFIKTKK